MQCWLAGAVDGMSGTLQVTSGFSSNSDTREPAMSPLPASPLHAVEARVRQASFELQRKILLVTPGGGVGAINAGINGHFAAASLSVWALAFPYAGRRHTRLVSHRLYKSIAWTDSPCRAYIQSRGVPWFQARGRDHVPAAVNINVDSARQLQNDAVSRN